MDTIYMKEERAFQRVYYSFAKITGYVPDVGSEIFVRNIPPKAEDSELLRFFEQAGPIFQIKIMISAATSELKRRFLYVTYKDSATAKKALDMLNKKKFHSEKLLMEISVNNCRIFVGGIPTGKTRDEVWMELKRCGVRNILDVIMYRSYTDRAENRGFIFVEFRTHDEAAYFRAKFHEKLRLFGKQVVVDWSVPIPEVDPDIMKDVKIVYLRNLPVWEDRSQLEKVITKFVTKDRLEKLYKFKNYAFIHLRTREEAEILLRSLKEYYKNEPVDIEWAKPANKFTSPQYRQLKVESMSSGWRSRNSSQSSTVSSLSSPSPRNSKKNLDLVCSSQGLNLSDLPKGMVCPNKLDGHLPRRSPVTPSTVGFSSPISSTNGSFSLFSSSFSAPTSLDTNSGSFSPFSPKSSSTSLNTSFDHGAHDSSQLDEGKRITAPCQQVLGQFVKIPSPVEYMNNAVKNKPTIPLVIGQLPCAMPDATYLTNWINNCLHTPSGSSESACTFCNFMTDPYSQGNY